MLRVLLKFCDQASIQDKSGNLPLHIALYRGLSEEITLARETLLDMVMPLLDAYSLGQDVENGHGETGHDLLQQLKKKIKTGYTLPREKLADSEEGGDSEDERWRKKLSDEASYEYEEQLPRYSYNEDHMCNRTTQETFDQFSERIRQEYTTQSNKKNQHTFWRDRKRKQGMEDRVENKKARKESEEEKLKAAREEMKSRFKPLNVDKISRFKSQKENYERKFSYLLSHLAGRTLTYGCVPWPCLDMTALAGVLFSDLPDITSTEYRKYLRVQQIRWHPDKFTQKFKDHLHPDHVVKIMAKVKAISQFLNNLNAELADKN
ncbi:hypothetical protein Btru_010934 [Bulinus truncatus]|nr:hypothetical protein Btru_010934 [Bulinus truncatus]